MGGGRFRVTMDTSSPAVHHPAPPTLRHQHPSSSIVDEFKWPKYKVRALGIWFSNDPEVTATLNYNDKLVKARNVLSCWKYRRLSLIGKITVLKSLVASQLVYVLSPLHTNAKTIKEVNKLFFSFLWNGKGDKIKRDIIINDYSNGGLKMIDIQSF